MYLRTLELHGFKSFPNKTTLNFERGTTIIVGPNGSGKSNISDAMRWVLGEISSRNIRGTKMEDVIFGGTDTRRPMSFAEVSVTFDNSDEAHRIDSPYDEITVTRRYYRSGESEYMINRKNCRLKDIHELFMNTGVGREGYSIIGQGKIAEILSRKSEDRRNIFEEAAGISKFRQRKEDAEKKLESTLANVESATLIFRELDARIGPLARDAEKARKYRDLLESKKSADVSLWLFDTEKTKKDFKAAEEAFQLATAEYDRLKEAIESLEQQSDHVHEQLTSSRLLSEQLMRQISDANRRLAVLENSYQLAIGNIRHTQEMAEQSKERFAQLDEEDARIKEAREKTRQKIEEYKERQKTQEADKLEILVAIDSLAKAAAELEQAIADALAVIEDKTAKATDLRVRLDVSRTAKQEGSGKEEELRREIARYEKEQEALEAELARCEKNTATYREKIAAAEKTFAEANEKIAAFRQQTDEKNKERNRIQAQTDGLSQRVSTLKSMEEHFEGYQQSVRFVMQEYAKHNAMLQGEIYGPISHLISIEEKYITAIETALGASLQNIVVEDDRTAKSAISLLKSAGAGRATFYPLSEIRPAGETDEIRQGAVCVGYVGRADKLIRFDEKYRPVMEWLLLRTLVFDNIDNAAAAAKKLRYKVRIVTLDGQIINVGAVFTGGSAKKDSGILSRSGHVESLERQIAEYQAELQKIDAEIAALAKDTEKENLTAVDAEQTKELLYRMSRVQLSEYDNAEAKRNAGKSLLEKLEGDLARITDSDGRYEEEIRRSEEALVTLEEEIAALKKERQETDIRRQGILDEKDEKNVALNDLRLAAAMLEKDIEAAENAMAEDLAKMEQHKKDRESTTARLAEFDLRCDSLEEEKKVNREEAERVRKTIEDLEAERAETEKNTDEFDRAENSLREKIRAANADKERCYTEYSRTEARRNKLKEDNERLENRLWDEYQITYEEALALDYPPVTAQNRAEVAALQSSCKAKIRELGSVNPGAIEEYEEVSVRHAELKRHLEDLEKARVELLDVIAKVEEEMRTNFSRTFEEINRNFGAVFSELFGGGQAELSLTDPEDVLTSGIEIKAAPPGKIIKSLSLLSGGEQTFVAIALIFAILKANPTPFCIFDEIEAALDEVNVDRFGAYVRKYSANTQFVLITHRRGTMEVGDRLYGITMPERGVSRALPLDVSEIESKQKELLG